MEHLVTHLYFFLFFLIFVDQVKADDHPPLHDSHNWKTATSTAPVRHQGTLLYKGLDSVCVFVFFGE